MSNSSEELIEEPKIQGTKDLAVALQYADRNDLPKVITSGAGTIARQIIELAKANNIPIQADKELAEMLVGLGQGENISPESYRLVAQVISFLYHYDKKWQAEHAQLKIEELE